MSIPDSRFEIHCLQVLFMPVAFSTEPLVSVIIPFLNEERFLAEAIESVLNQEYANWELLLIDDGSAEQTSSIAKHSASAHPGKIFYYDHKDHANRGVCVSRNSGVSKSKGSLIAFLDADDVWMPLKLKNQVEIFQHHPQAGMACEASWYWYSWTNSEKKDELIMTGEHLEGVYQPGELSKLLYPLGRGAAPCPSSVMVKKDVCEAIGGFEESFTGIYQLYEDQAFLSKIYLHYPVYISSACHNFYRCQRQGSTMHSVIGGGKYHQVRKYFLKYLLEYFRQKNITDPQLLKLLHKAYLPYGKGFKNLVQRIINKAARYFLRQ